MFKAMFACMVEDGRKRQTVRPWPRRIADAPRVGDVIDCRCWEGAPYRSKQTKLAEGVITAVAAVVVDEAGIGLWETGGKAVFYRLNRQAAEAFAVADGFPGLAEMLAWFEATHGLPFEGVMIKWELVAPQ